MKSSILKFADIAKVEKITMALSVSTSEAKAKLSSFVQRVVKNREAVIIENRGTPQAVLISYGSYEEYSRWKEEDRRRRALEELRKLADQVQSRNQDLSAAEAENLADRFSRDVVDELIVEGKIKVDPGAG